MYFLCGLAIANNMAQSKLILPVALVLANRANNNNSLINEILHGKHGAHAVSQKHSINHS